MERKKEDVNDKDDGGGRMNLICPEHFQVHSGDDYADVVVLLCSSSEIEWLEINPLFEMKFFHILLIFPSSHLLLLPLIDPRGILLVLNNSDYHPSFPFCSCSSSATPLQPMPFNWLLSYIFE